MKCKWFVKWIKTVNKSDGGFRKHMNYIVNVALWSQNAEPWQWTFMLAVGRAALHYSWRASLPSWAFDETSSSFLSSLLPKCESCELVSSLIKITSTEAWTSSTICCCDLSLSFLHSFPSFYLSFSSLLIPLSDWQQFTIAIELILTS